MPELDDSVKLLEEEAARDVGAYRRRLMFLAILGYAYIAGILLVLVALAALVIIALMKVHNLLLLKIAFIAIVLIGLILKSMWIKFDPPKGIIVKKSEAPQLFEAIEGVRIAAGGPHIHAVVLSDEFTCAVTQVPRLGAFGFYKNYVILGMPLMQALSLPQFKAVLAHEMGHLSEQHGKFGSWIYHVRRSWEQMYVNLASHSHFGDALIKRFVNWYVPLFDKQSLVMCRLQEFDADRISASVCGAETFAMALVNTVLKGALLHEKFWPQQFKQIEELNKPPKDIMHSMAVSLQQHVAPEYAATLLEQRDHSHDPYDTHPSPYERIKALLPDEEIEDLHSFYARHANTDVDAENAAELLFGNRLESFSERTGQLWCEGVTNQWSIQHEACKSARKQLNEIEEEAVTGPLTEERSLTRAAIYAFLDEPDSAISIYRELLESSPENAEFHFELGKVLLEKNDAEGADHLERALKRDLKYACESHALLYEYFKKQRNSELADQHLKTATALAEEIQQHASTYNEISRHETFSEHKLSEKNLQDICALVHAQLPIKEAWIVSRKLPEVLGGHQHVFVVRMLSSGISPNVSDAEATSVYKALANGHSMFGDCFIMPRDGATPNLAKACDQLPGARIYDRKTYQPGELPVASSVQRTETRSPAPFVLLGALAVIFFLIAMFGGFWGHEEIPDAPKQVADGIDFGPYMSDLQLSIKRNWRPPKGDRTNRVMLHFKVHSNGELSDLAIANSSGLPTMDEAALDAVSRTAPFSPLPKGAPENVDIEFSLDYNVHNQR
jgi:TonB family protein